MENNECGYVNTDKDRKVATVNLAIQAGYTTIPSEHVVTEYIDANGYSYFVFEHTRGTAIMNYVAEDYETLSHIINIGADCNIYMIGAHGLSLVPVEYRRGN